MGLLSGLAFGFAIMIVVVALLWLGGVITGAAATTLSAPRREGTRSLREQLSGPSRSGR
jgi:hypothetical protein